MPATQPLPFSTPTGRMVVVNNRLVAEYQRVVVISAGPNAAPTYYPHGLDLSVLWVIHAQSGYLQRFLTGSGYFEWIPLPYVSSSVGIQCAVTVNAGVGSILMDSAGNFSTWSGAYNLFFTLSNG